MWHLRLSTELNSVFGSVLCALTRKKCIWTRVIANDLMVFCRTCKVYRQNRSWDMLRTKYPDVHSLLKDETMISNLNFHSTYYVGHCCLNQLGYKPTYFCTFKSLQSIRNLKYCDSKQTLICTGWNHWTTQPRLSRYYWNYLVNFSVPIVEWGYSWLKLVFFLFWLMQPVWTG